MPLCFGACPALASIVVAVVARLGNLHAPHSYVASSFATVEKSISATVVFSAEDMGNAVTDALSTAFGNIESDLLLCFSSLLYLFLHAGLYGLTAYQTLKKNRRHFNGPSSSCWGLQLSLAGHKPTPPSPQLGASPLVLPLSGLLVLNHIWPLPAQQFLVVPSLLIYKCVCTYWLSLSGRNLGKTVPYLGSESQ